MQESSLPPGVSMSCRILAAALAVGVIASPAAAAPSLHVTHVAINSGGNLDWTVGVAPDPALFSDSQQGFGGSLAVELAFEVSGTDVIGAVANAAQWPFEVPGNNPFAGAVTFGVVTDLTADTVFVSLGSDFFTTGDSVDVLTIETIRGTETTLSWGGHTVLPGAPEEYMGSRIAQAGMNFDGYQGSPIVALGDMNCDGDVDFDDTPAFVLGLSDSDAYEAIYGVAPELKGDTDFQNDLDFDDIPGFLHLLPGGGLRSATEPLRTAAQADAGFGNAAAPVPEPSAMVLALVGAVCLLGWRSAVARKPYGTSTTFPSNRFGRYETGTESSLLAMMSLTQAPLGAAAWRVVLRVRRHAVGWRCLGLARFCPVFPKSASKIN
jgi:hypothetical protein